MLQSIRLKNFKLHEDTKIDFAPFTIFIGPNNSGKSSIFHAVQLLQQVENNRLIPYYKERNTKVGEPKYFNKKIDAGSYEDIVRNKKKPLEVEIKAKGRVNGDYLKIGNTVLKVGFSFIENRLNGHWGEFKGGELEFSWKTEEIHDDQHPIGTINLKNGAITVYIYNFRDDTNFSRFLSFKMKEKNREDLNLPEISLKIQQDLEKINEVIRSVIDSMLMVYGIRGLEEYAYPSIDNPMPTLQLLFLDDRNISLANTLIYNRKLEKNLSSWFEEMLGLGIYTEMKTGRRIYIGAERKNNSIIPFINEGLGTQQLVHMLIPIAMAEKGSTIAIEEPEIHFHPKAQADLVDLFMKINKKEDKQFIMATHSEHILYRFLTAVAKKEIKKKDLAIYYFENVKGKAKVKKVEFDRYGRVKGGLPGFFESEIDNLTEYLEAISK